MESQVTVIVIEFLSVMAEILETTLGELNSVEVVGMAKDYISGEKLISELHPDFLVFDYNPHQSINSLEMLETFRVNFPDMGIIIITEIDISEHINKLMELKVIGIIDKASTRIHLRASLKCALNNQFILPNTYLPKLLSGARTSKNVPLTDRDIHIMRMIMEDKTRGEIASFISVSKRSVDNYLNGIYKKLGCSNRMEAVGIFARSNIEQYLKEGIKG
jgi:two-component system competent response regulator ComA